MIVSEEVIFINSVRALDPARHLLKQTSRELILAANFLQYFGPEVKL